MTNSDRVAIHSSIGHTDIFTPEFNALVADLYDKFKDRVAGAREARLSMQCSAMRGQKLGHLPPSEASTSAWSVPSVPAELRKPGIEISGPAAQTSMFINALNPGPEGEPHHVS